MAATRLGVRVVDNELRIGGGSPFSEQPHGRGVDAVSGQGTEEHA